VSAPELDPAGEPASPHGELTDGLADPRGIPRLGRQAEHDLLRAAGAHDLAWGRLYEGHVNALQLVARLGDDAQRLRAEHDAARGLLFGVWNTQAQDGVRIAMADADGVTLTGRKTFGSGAGRVRRAIVTAAWPDGRSQITLIPMDAVEAGIDPSFWKPYGMEDSDSYAVDFSGVRLRRDALIGAPGDYERAPWFTAGASRFVAVQTGGIERLVADFAEFLKRRNYAEDALQLARLGECVVDARTALLWTNACVAAWLAYDAEPSDAAETQLNTTVDAARNAVERVAFAVMERIERGVGARGLLESEPFMRRLRDLRMYLRQPAVDATLARVARASLPS
jgi:alkylation response protein AidB-like acyl-CoA dehydrogenase